MTITRSTSIEAAREQYRGNKAPTEPVFALVSPQVLGKARF